MADNKIRSLIPGYMSMGADGMGEYGQMVEAGHMPIPENSISMVGAPGPFAYITTGGMFNVLKVRENLASYNDPDWYEHPEGTVASLASAEELKRDGIGTNKA